MKSNARFYIKSIEDLDVRAFNIFKYNFGNTDALLNYFRENGSFYKVRNAGSKTNIQLISLCKYLLENIELKSNDDAKVVDDFSQIPSDDVIVKFYGELKSNLSVRASNILRQIEDDYQSNIISFVKSIAIGNIDFLSIRNCGEKTKLELQEFSRRLKDKTELLDEISFKSEFSSFSDADYFALEELYLILKKDISIRGCNILSKLEEENSEDQNKFIKEIVSGEIDFKAIRNCGEKTKQELSALAKSLREFFLNSKKQYSDSTENNLIHLKTNRVFPQIPESVIEQIVINETTYDINKLMLAAIYFNDFRDNKREIIQELFQTTGKISLEAISAKLKISKERVRQILKEFFNNDVDDFYSKIILHYSSFTNQYFETNSKTFVKTEDIDFDYLEQTFTPNPKLGNCIYKSILKNDFDNCLDIYEITKSEFNALNKSSLEGVFISKKLNSSINFADFLKWIEEQLFNFEKYDIEFDMEVLILRYFNSSNQIENKLVNQLAEFISENKSDFTGTTIRRKGERELRKMETVNLCHSYIEQLNQPVKTNELIEMLFKNGIQVEKQELLKLLNNQRDQFSSFGHGSWALSSWRSDGLIGGSIRDIVLSLLNNTEDPLHVSEILNYLAQFRQVTLRSLLTNLRAANNGVFIFFNCNFIGTQSKNYNSKWHNLPRINGRHFGEDMLNNARRHNLDIAEYYYKKYKYPKINTEFLLNLKD